MQINIYYGGRGLMDDPTLFVIKKMKEVLEELRVTVEVEEKKGIRIPFGLCNNFILQFG